MKKLTILKHGGGELANQLWNYLSVYAFGLEMKTKVRNPSFFEYHPYFNFIETESVLTKIFSFWFRDSLKRRGSPRNRFWRFVYSLYSKIISIIFCKSLISSENTKGEVIYLPPTKDTKIPEKNNIYFLGWLFRNPKGLLKYRSELVSHFAPQSKIQKRIEEILHPVRDIYKHIIGVHIRQGDYKIFKNGTYLIHQERVSQILDEYIVKKSLNRKDVLFVLTTDGKIDESLFKGLNTYISKENAVTDLFLLSKTDTIIGSDSSFGAFAAWYGDIPHIIMKKDSIDWTYYENKKTFFENKYCTLLRQ